MMAADLAVARRRSRRRGDRVFLEGSSFHAHPTSAWRFTARRRREPWRLQPGSCATLWLRTASAAPLRGTAAPAAARAAHGVAAWRLGMGRPRLWLAPRPLCRLAPALSRMDPRPLVAPRLRECLDPGALALRSTILQADPDGTARRMIQARRRRIPTISDVERVKRDQDCTCPPDTWSPPRGKAGIRADAGPCAVVRMRQRAECQAPSAEAFEAYGPYASGTAHDGTTPARQDAASSSCSASSQTSSATASSRVMAARRVLARVISSGRPDA